MKTVKDILQHSPTNDQLRASADNYARRHELRNPDRYSEGIKQAEREYWKRVHSTPESEKREPLNYEQAKAILWRIMQIYSNAFRSGKDGFLVDDYNRGLIQELTKYFIGEFGKLDPCKGVLLWGNPGTGKTVIMRIFSELTKHPAVLHRYNVITCYDVVNDYSQLGQLAADKYAKYNRCFDDLGAEPCELKLYGNVNNPMAQILTRRYERWERGQEKTMTFITTNLNESAILDRYGPRVYDRIRAMCNIIELKGTSRR